MKILVADDDLLSLKMLTGILTDWGYEVIPACTGDEALRVLESENGPNLAILDWLMPGATGKELCEKVRSREKERHTYLLLLTAKVGHADIIQGLEAGADDYLTKPYNALELKARLTAGRRVVDLQERLLATQEVLRHQAITDGLTGTSNRRHIMEMLERELLRSRRQGQPLGLILSDLDYFKRINDNYGHLAGDEVLREAARRMKMCARLYDLVGRYGGEEFLIALPGCDDARAAKWAERLRKAIAAKPVCFQQHSIAITASFGVVSCDSAQHQHEGLHSIIQAADAALYRAKNAGRNRVEIAEPLRQTPMTSLDGGGQVTRRLLNALSPSLAPNGSC